MPAASSKGASDATGRRRGRRAWFMRLSLAVFSPILVFILLEGGLRLGGYGSPTQFFLGPDAVGTFVTNYRFGWRFFPRQIARSPHPHILPAKAAGTIRIFILGESAAMGTPDAAFSFGRILEVMLRERYPDMRFEVVNAAMTAINSHVVREIARDCADRNPDLFVVYMGNNEVIGPYGPGTVFQRWSPGLAMIRASVWVKATRVGQLLGDAIGGLGSGAGTPRRWRGLEMFKNNPVAADDPRLNSVYDHYRQNLTDICNIALRARAGVVLSTVAVNLRDFAPLASRHRVGLTSEELTKWEAAVKMGAELQSSNRWDEAVGYYQEAARIDDRFAALQFRIGVCLLKSGRFAEARDRFELARDLDALRFRADSRINAIIREVASERSSDGVRLVDAERTLAESGSDAGGIAGEGVFYEHVHLKFTGNYLLARAVLEPVCAALPQLADLIGHGVIPSRQRCAELLVLTSWDEYQLADKMVELTSGEPFVNQMDYELRQAAARQRRDELRELASTPQAAAAVWNIYTAALAKTPHDWELRHRLGLHMLKWGHPDAAVEHLQFVVGTFPLEPAKRCDLGDALNSQRRMDEAIVQYRKALELMPFDVDARISLGASLWMAGRPGDAIVHFQRALTADPGHEVAHNNLGSALTALGRVDEAIVSYQKAVELKPDYVEARKNLGVVLLKNGQGNEAIVHFQKAVELSPNDADAHVNLGMALMSTGRAEAAIPPFRMALKLQPGNAAAEKNLRAILNSAPAAH